MSTRYKESFKNQVVKEYMEGCKSTIEIAAEYNIAKSTIRGWAKKYTKNVNIPPILMNQSQQKKFADLIRNYARRKRKYLS